MERWWIALVLAACTSMAASARAQDGPLRNDAFAFDVRVGGSIAYSALDAGNTIERRMGYGGFIGLDFLAPLAHFSEHTSLVGALHWNVIELRAVEPGLSLAGATDYGVGVGIRHLLGGRSYLQATLGYFGAGDGQAIYPDPGDGLGMFHSIEVRTRARFEILAIELAGGGVPTIGGHFSIGARLHLGSVVWLGVDFDGYFADRESVVRQGRQVYATRFYLSFRMGE